MTKTIYRSASTGEIVTEEFAKQNPATTVKETILKTIDRRGDLVKFCDFLEENGRTVDYTLVDEYLNKE